MLTPSNALRTSWQVNTLPNMVTRWPKCPTNKQFFPLFPTDDEWSWRKRRWTVFICFCLLLIDIAMYLACYIFVTFQHATQTCFVVTFQHAPYSCSCYSPVLHRLLPFIHSLFCHFIYVYIHRCQILHIDRGLTWLIVQTSSVSSQTSLSLNTSTSSHWPSIPPLTV